MAAEAARELERFMGVPLPIDSIIFRFVDYEHSFLGFSAALVNQDIVVVRDSYPNVDRSNTQHRRLVYHEMAHHYFNHLGPYYTRNHASPNWLDEGGANFMEAYIDDRFGFQPLRARLDQVATSARSNCMERGFENILKLTVPSPPDRQRWQSCQYILGEYMVLSLYFAIGEPGLSAALREVYVTGHFFHPFPLRHSQGYPSDLQLYQTFLKHTPPGREDAVRDVYRRIHGGPYIPPDN